MKSYTDLEQSKALAKILNEDTADLWWDTSEFKPRLEKHYSEYLGVTIDPIPCWSLAALIEILPNIIVIDGQRWWLSIRKNSISYLGRITLDGRLNISVKGDNPVDACYEMIIKLNEQNLLVK